MKHTRDNRHRKYRWLVVSIVLLSVIPLVNTFSWWLGSWAVASANREHAEWDRVQNAAKAALREGRFADAERSARSAKELARRERISPNWRSADSAYLLGAVYYVQEQFQDAARQFEESVEVQERCDGPDADELVRPLVRLADTETKLGKLDSALEHAKRALSIRQALYAEADAELIAPLEELATVHEARGEYDQALRYRSKVIDLRKTLLQNATKDVAAAYLRAARTHRLEGNPGAADELSRRALETLRESGDIDPKIVDEFYEDLERMLREEKGEGE